MTSSFDKPSFAFIVPVYNEEGMIAKTVGLLQQVATQVPQFNVEIVCVNDGSSDRTADVLKTLPGITILTHPKNRGYGAALRTGLEYAQTEWVAIVDADGTYPIHDMPTLMASATDDYVMVVGARKGIGISSNPGKRIARWVLRRLVKRLTGVMVPDLNSGMRIFRKSLYMEFRHLLPSGFSFTSTITVASLYSGYNVKYLPIDYAVRSGKSHIRPVQDFFGFTVLIVRVASYFDPLRFFIPLSTTVLLAAFLKVVRDLWLMSSIGSLSVIMTVLALQIFLTGVVVDVVVRRSLVGVPTAKLSEQNVKITKNPEHPRA